MQRDLPQDLKHQRDSVRAFFVFLSYLKNIFKYINYYTHVYISILYTSIFYIYIVGRQK